MKGIIYNQGGKGCAGDNVVKSNYFYQDFLKPLSSAGHGSTSTYRLTATANISGNKYITFLGVFTGTCKYLVSELNGTTLSTVKYATDCSSTIGAVSNIVKTSKGVFTLSANSNGDSVVSKISLDENNNLVIEDTLRLTIGGSPYTSNFNNFCRDIVVVSDKIICMSASGTHNVLDYENGRITLTSLYVVGTNPSIYNKPIYLSANINGDNTFVATFESVSGSMTTIVYYELNGTTATAKAQITMGGLSSQIQRALLKDKTIYYCSKSGYNKYLTQAVIQNDYSVQTSQLQGFSGGDNIEILYKSGHLIGISVSSNNRLMYYYYDLSNKENGYFNSGDSSNEGRAIDGYLINGNLITTQGYETTLRRNKAGETNVYKALNLNISGKGDCYVLNNTTSTKYTFNNTLVVDDKGVVKTDGTTRTGYLTQYSLQ